ncbi:type VI secretion system membrane subunit TssM [Geoalkalibacter halelectricus]|uniref:Type VI secretion system membrane subunit TssM n=1 Tax=Geoalkalibacter halelectricus TaxID=2847045 RepID=A0ABY5ZPK0_9BACT|nr:type VI secretion system membrane subunit TssM [Geoalkalibacter halelectricus]MDO3379320.1 type VI secretion system membrane subunit TssM [Geoalkalibacter halelectricus]UWZ81072.1 type VI secretion system membrane subunit TssM [Geoalkalibacter halelectricus]
MRSFLLLLQGYLLGRTGSRVVGVLLLISLVWWGGPYVGLTDETLRLWIIVAILCLILMAWAVRLVVVRRRAGRFHAELQQQQGQEQDDRRFEIEELQRKMNEAVATLKSSELGVNHRGSAALYALPWFMIIGPSAAGKTTLLRHSGLHFPYAEEGDIDIRGFGGTRNCDWWFSNEAVLLDTAGRYTTEPADHSEWKAFLALLRKHRRRMPINGVLVAISLEDLLTGDQNALAQHVKIIRDRIDELTTDLGCLVPVYLVITKCDLLHGFVSFFEDLGEHDRSQVWGAWLGENSDPETLSEAFEARLKELYERLCAMRLRKLSMQRRFAAKAQIHEFPAEFQVAAERLGEFTRLLFKQNPYQETPRFCGVYLTSATQEGTPLQRILGNMRQAFGYVEETSAVPREAVRSYFVKKVFQDIVFTNAQAGIKTRRREVVARLLKSTWVLASLALILGSFMVLSTSLTSNTLVLQRGSAAAEQVRFALAAAEPQPRKVLASLDDLHAHYTNLRDYERKLPWHLVLGVYQGGAQIDPSRRILLDALELSFFQPVARALEFRLENQIRQWETMDEKGREKIRRDYYEDLRTYLMMARPEHLDQGTALPRLTEIWRKELLRGTDQGGDEIGLSEQRLLELAGFFLAHLGNPSEQWAVAPWAARDAMVDQAREQLRTPPKAQQLYAQIIEKSRVELKDRTLEDLIRGYDFGLLTSGFKLPGVFTERGWREFVHPQIDQAVRSASRGDWVIGLQHDAEAADDGSAAARHGYINAELAARLEKEIRQIYFADYVEAWYGLLDSVRIAPFTSLDDAGRKILILSRSDGPIGELMRVVSRNINLSEGGSAGLETLAGQLVEGQGAGRNLVAELEGPLRDLRKFCDPADKMTVSLLINQYLLAISALQGEVERLGAAVDVPREAGSYAANILTGGGASSELYKSWVSTSSLLGGIEARTRRVAGNLLMAPLRQSWQIILAETRKDLQRSWQNSVYAAYGQKVEGRFPFVANGRDAALVDVSDFFRPDDGVLWNFVNQNLAPFLSRERNGWRQKTWLDQGPGFNRNLLEGLEQAQLISESLFRRGGSQPEVQFYLYPMPSRGLSEMYLESNGQHYRYRNEPQEWRKFRWPGDMERLGARIHGVTGTGSGRAELGFEGIWGLFHLLGQADLRAESGTHYLSVWELDDGNGMPLAVQFRIRADRENNVFERGLFSDLSLPERIF